MFSIGFLAHLKKSRTGFKPETIVNQYGLNPAKIRSNIQTQKNPLPERVLKIAQ
jgi:hypothetical protein